MPYLLRSGGAAAFISRRLCACLYFYFLIPTWYVQQLFLNRCSLAGCCSAAWGRKWAKKNSESPGHAGIKNQKLKRSNSTALRRVVLRLAFGMEGTKWHDLGMTSWCCVRKRGRRKEWLRRQFVRHLYDQLSIFNFLIYIDIFIHIFFIHILCTWAVFNIYVMTWSRWR